MKARSSAFLEHSPGAPQFWKVSGEINNWGEGCDSNDDFIIFPSFQKQAVGLGLAQLSLSNMSLAGEWAGATTPNFIEL